MPADLQLQLLGAFPHSLIRSTRGVELSQSIKSAAIKMRSRMINDGFLTPLVPNLPSNTRWFASPTAGLPFFGSRNLALYIRFDNWNGGNTRLLSVDNADTLMD
ncbi:Protein of unknown function [Pyronema omphalodes CBS 100304]|uniref:Uncharacterized protein n=1 Tax=Pyronema omphalodes (strain CBS 100304) TaxID=1076935 RepID=U4LPM4_PYROM|nr:Protein of unknown function [Pyronema omphalodes CBS 100304]